MSSSTRNSGQTMFGERISNAAMCSCSSWSSPLFPYSSRPSVPKSVGRWRSISSKSGTFRFDPVPGPTHDLVSFSLARSFSRSVSDLLLPLYVPSCLFYGESPVLEAIIVKAFGLVLVMIASPWNAFKSPIVFFYFWKPSIFTFSSLLTF